MFAASSLVTASGREHREVIMRSLTIPLLAAALFVGASSAHAEMKVVARAGAWSASAGTADTGKPMCQMASTNNDIRTVQIKWVVVDGLFLHVGKDNWKVPVGVEMPLAIRFDQETPFKVTAKGLADHPRWIELKIDDATDARHFVDQFRTAAKLSVSFPGGNEREWVLSMDGSDTIVRKFTECVAAVKKKYDGPATQPFADKTPPKDADRL
jgi:hypothetical protein